MTPPNKSIRACADSPSGCCGHAAQELLTRRDFAKWAGAATAGTLFGELLLTRAIAGPYDPGDFAYSLIPADKRLSPQWLKSLTERGKPSVWSGTDLRYIGMPVGGFFTGQLYLGGDGRLWNWDVFNAPESSQVPAAHYETAMTRHHPVAQGFALRTGGPGGTVRALDQSGFPDVTFCGQYPVGTITYRDPAFPVSVVLEAFSPFIPLDAEDSGLPATVMRFTLHNHSAQATDVELAGWLENAVSKFTHGATGVRSNRIVREGGALRVDSSAQSSEADFRDFKNREAHLEIVDTEPGSWGNTSIDSTRFRDAGRPDILLSDFENGYAGWTVEGTAFGKSAAIVSEMPPGQSPSRIGAHGLAMANSYASAEGGPSDAATGRLVGDPFTIDRDFIRFLIGGGRYSGKLAVRLFVDDRLVGEATGHNDNKLRYEAFEVRKYAGRRAHLEIVDDFGGAWGNVGADFFVQTDRPFSPVPASETSDFGTMSLALLDAGNTSRAASDVPEPDANSVFRALDSAGEVREASRAIPLPLAGAVSQSLRLAPGETREVSFVIAWHFPSVRYNLEMPPAWERIRDFGQLRRYYAKRFRDAADVARYVAKDYARLAGQTLHWRDTWYDSTLPWWFLDRTFLNLSTLATATCHRFDNGRYWFWEGIYCCDGTCTHVWHYAQGIGRVFPEIERDQRERVDFGIGFNPDSGMIGMRAETSNIPATDGQAGTILRALREHRMSADRSFLDRNWPRIQKAVEWLVDQDENADGIITRGQPNTLDAEWYGAISWISSLYIAALQAGAEMAREMGENVLAARWSEIAEKGSRYISEKLFHKDQYFIQQIPPEHMDKLGSGYGCEIDQVFGQSWAFQVGLPRVLPEEKTRKALESLWRYNFAPDVGPFLKKSPIPGGRVFAMPGEGGLVMCTFPDPEHPGPAGDGHHAFYFNECMTGFEYQVASHMIWEGGDLVEKGLAITRMIHDRYHASRRNPWNEVECGDHYGRALASYGVFIAACGFEYDGPKRFIGFAPRLTPEDFKAPFISAEGWGTFSQKITGGTMEAKLAVAAGKVSLKTIALATTATKVSASLAGQPVAATVTTTDGRAIISLDVTIESGQELVLNLS